VTEPVWVRDDVVLAIHRRQIAEHGGAASALAKPKNLLAYSGEAPDLAALAASYGFGIARYHPFLEGNKRTAYVVCRTFLLLNGLDLSASKEEKYTTFLRLAEGQLSEAELGAWIRQRVGAGGSR
jgi:death-on-curing protein